MAETAIPLRPVGKRKLKNWLDSWVEYTNELGSPDLWCKWTGIAILAGALEQKVWCTTNKGQLFPNQFILLVGPPGSGKTVLTSAAREYWETLREENETKFFIAANSVSAQSLLDEVNDAKRFVTVKGEQVEFNSVSASLNELSTFLADYENIFTSVLQELYDCKPMGERKRTGNKKYTIKHPQLNMLSGCTPGYLAGNIPEAAWDQGFLARTMMVYSGALPQITDVFSAVTKKDALGAALKHDLKHIHELFGEMDFTDPVRKALLAWQQGGMLPLPEHPKLMHYNTRRLAHVLKLSMIACAAASDSFQVELEHYQTALGWLLQAEHTMSEMFKALQVGATRSAMDQVWYECSVMYAKTKTPIKEDVIIRLLGAYVDAPSLMRVFDVMKKAKILEEQFGNEFIPRARKPGL